MTATLKWNKHDDEVEGRQDICYNVFGDKLSTESRKKKIID